MQCNSSAIHITYLLEGQYLKLKLKYMLKYLPHDKRSFSSAVDTFSNPEVLAVIAKLR